jgi:hypothetical protein
LESAIVLDSVDLLLYDVSGDECHGVECLAFVNDYITKVGKMPPLNITIKEEPVNILINEEGENVD